MNFDRACLEFFSLIERRNQIKYIKSQLCSIGKDGGEIMHTAFVSRITDTDPNVVRFQDIIAVALASHQVLDCDPHGVAVREVVAGQVLARPGVRDAPAVEQVPYRLPIRSFVRKIIFPRHVLRTLTGGFHQNRI